MLQSESTAIFNRDVKRLVRKHRDMGKLKDVMRLIIEDTAESAILLGSKHNAHRLKGQWADCSECHIHNEGDWLLIWIRNDATVTFLRTGSHDELFD
ncbi:type II toxin-antitoxin system YafQ family toxin [Bifidobacterium sp.]|uniref:type II toxin-antitoxin system RelE/ParE family toxin n=1 Tax=Bifidobacterium sp. TaxID=41200 RepID=UPI0039EC3C3E